MSGTGKAVRTPKCTLDTISRGRWSTLAAANRFLPTAP